MRTIRILLLSLVVVSVMVALQPTKVSARERQPQQPGEAECTGAPPPGCTVFTISKGDRVYFGGNDDFIDVDSTYWVEAGDEDSYAVIWIGQRHDVQQGVNEAGLAYDANGLPRVHLSSHPERVPLSSDLPGYPKSILRDCATVQEVVDWVQTHQYPPTMAGQLQFADASGDAVIISPDSNGELVFTRKASGDGYLLSTNFNVIDPGHRNGDYPCWRYETAQQMLDQLVTSGDVLQAQDAADVLDAVHVEKASGWTKESLVVDLTNRVIYLYYFHQYDRPIVLDVSEEFASPRDPGQLSALFPEDVRQEASRRHRQILGRADSCLRLGKGWMAAVIASLALVIVLSPLVSRRNSVPARWSWVWIPVVVILGPLGFLIWLLVVPVRVQNRWRSILMEVTLDITPTAVGFLVYLSVLLFYPGLVSSELKQLLLLLLMPMGIGWLLFSGPLLALSTKRGYLRILGQRLAPALLAANLSLAGITAVAVPLASEAVDTCAMFPTPGWNYGILWAIVALSSLGGGLLLLPYKMWATRRGYMAWSVIGSGAGQLRSPSWRVLWWWLPISYAMLVAGMAASVILQQ